MYLLFLPAFLAFGVMFFIWLRDLNPNRNQESKPEEMAEPVILLEAPEPLPEEANA
jgi:hypothetical protein